MRLAYPFIGAIIGATTSLAINLLSAVIQARTPPEQFSNLSIGWLIAAIIVGILAGLWFGKELVLPTEPESTTKANYTPESPKTVRITRLSALLSYGKLRGKGIALKDILLIGSRLNIDTRK